MTAQVQAAVRHSRRLKWWRHLAFQAFWYLLLSALALVLALPLVWLVSTSFKTGAQTSLCHPSGSRIPSSSPTTRSFPGRGFRRYFWNTIYITLNATAGTLLTASLAGYAFARLRFPCAVCFRPGPFDHHAARHRDPHSYLYRLPSAGLD